MEALDKYLEAEGEIPSLTQTVLEETTLSSAVDELGTMPFLHSSSSSSSSSSTDIDPENGSYQGHHRMPRSIVDKEHTTPLFPSSSSSHSQLGYENHHARRQTHRIHRSTDDELQPPHIQDARRRQRIDEILSRTVQEREQDLDREMDQFLARLEAAQKIRLQQFRKLKQAIELEFEEIELELNDNTYNFDEGGKNNHQYLTDLEYTDKADDDSDDRDALNISKFLRDFDDARTMRNRTRKTQMQQWKQELNSNINVNTKDEVDDSKLSSRINAGMEALDISSSSPPRPSDNDAASSKSRSDETLDDLLGFDLKVKENSDPFLNANLSESTINIDLDSSKMDEHMLNLMGSNDSVCVDASNNYTHRVKLDLNSSQPAKPIALASLEQQQQQQPSSSSSSSSTAKKDNKSVTFSLGSSAIYKDSLPQSVGSKSTTMDGNDKEIFLPPQYIEHHHQQQDIKLGGDGVDAGSGTNLSVIHGNFDMSSRGPGKHKRGRLR